ncbi:MAG: hypothetical protein GY757_18975 [bacterium]|nr:hypothetical protein [bacterium]
MKTYVYVKLGKEKDGYREWEIIESGECDNSCDAITAIGRGRRRGEILGCGIDENSAFKDALWSTLT